VLPSLVYLLEGAALPSLAPAFAFVFVFARGIGGK